MALLLVPIIASLWVSKKGAKNAFILLALLRGMSMAGVLYFYLIHQASANFLIPICFLEAWGRQLFKHSSPGLKFQDQAN
jgi:hypothetical protein